jgi:hypothetical protein
VLGCTCCCIQVVLSWALLWCLLLLLLQVAGPFCSCCCWLRARRGIQAFLQLLLLLLLLLPLQGSCLFLQLLLLDAPQLLQDLDLLI